MRTLNKSWLENNPTGDEKSVITFHASRKDNFGMGLNPDGSRPQISIKSTAETHLQNLAMLQMLSDNEGIEAFSEGLVEGFLDAAVKNGADPETLDPQKVLQTPGEFVTAEFTLDMGGDDEQDSEDATSVSFEITAPCALYAVQAFRKTVTSRSLQQAAIGMCPEIDDDEYGDANEVLILD